MVQVKVQGLGHGTGQGSGIGLRNILYCATILRNAGSIAQPYCAIQEEVLRNPIWNHTPKQGYKRSGLEPSAKQLWKSEETSEVERERR